jgi:cyanophycinase
MPAHIPPHQTRGELIAIGGAEDKQKERRVLSQLCQLAGGAAARIAILATASTIPAELAGVYLRVFGELGAGEVINFPILQRADTMDSGLLERLESCTLVFFTGGDQLRLVATLGGTPVAQVIRRMNARGVPVAGTSAGAAAICQHMIGRGRSGQVMGRHMVSLAPGLGLTNRIVVDQHFSQRHRMGRLLSAISLNPFLVGVGIDEDTAACIDADNVLSVWGRGCVTVVDGSELVYTTVHEVEGRTPAAVLGTRVHVMTPGCTFDLINRQARAPVPG